jgi:hypothetical protein
MAAFTRRQFAGAAEPTTTTSLLSNVGTSVTIAGTLGWPSAPGVPFYVVIEAGTVREEKCLATVSGTTLTLTRAQDDTTAYEHAIGSTIYPVFTANDADEANEIVSKLTTKGDLLATTGTTLERLPVGSNGTFLKANSSSSVGTEWSGITLGTDTNGNYMSSIVSGTGVTVVHTPSEGSEATLSIGQAIGTADSPTFAGATIDAIKIGVTDANTIDTTTGNLTINSSGGLVTIDDNVNITGALTVSGSVTYINTTNLQVGDNIITLNADEVGEPSQNAGIEVERGIYTNVLLQYNETLDKWELTNDGSSYSPIETTSTVVTKLKQQLWLNDVYLATTEALPNSPTYTAGTSDQNGGTGVGGKIKATTDGLLYVDGAAAALNHRILVKNQANGLHNGIYKVTNVGSPSSTWELTRSSDFDNSTFGQATYGKSVRAALGSINRSQSFALSSFGSTYLNELEEMVHVFDSDVITWSQMSGKATLIPGNGLQISDNVLSLPTISQSNTASTSGASNFVQGINVDSYGRITGVTTNDAQIELGANTLGNYVQSVSASAGSGITVSGTGEGATVTVGSNATSSNSACAIVIRDANGNFSAGTITAALNGNSSTAYSLYTPRSIGLNGDLSGSVSFDGSQDVVITAAIQPNSITLGTDTAGSYVESLVQGTGVTVTNNSGEGSTPTIAIGQAVGTTASVTFAQVTADLIGTSSYARSLTNGRTIELTGDVKGSVSFDGSQDVQISASVQPNSVALGTDTTGNYVNDVTAGTGVTVTHTPGEGSSPTISIGQAVGTGSSVQFAAVTAPLIGNASTASTLQTGRKISLTGDLSGSVSFDGSQDVQISASVQPNSVSLGTDTTGSYVESLVQGTGITISNNTGEGATPTIAVTANTYDSYGAAGTAETNAKSYADSLVNGLTTSEIEEGSNKYFTNQRAIDAASASYDAYGAAASAVTTANSYTDLQIGNLTTSDVEEGSNRYFTNQRAIDAASASYDAYGAASSAITTANNYTDSEINGLTTSDIEEGANLYFTNQRAIDAASATYDAYGAASSAQSAAESYALGLGSNYDAVGSASAAYTNATNYADGLASNYDPAGSAATAQTNAENYADGLTYATTDLTDVTITSVSVSDILTWDGSKWVNKNNIHVTSTLESTDEDSGALIVDGGVGVKKNLHVRGVGHFGVPPTINLDNAVGYFTETAVGPLQVGLQNLSSASVSSGDYVVTANDGTDTTKYIDLGINSSTYADPDYSSTTANDGYLYVNGGHLVIGTATGGKDIKLIVGGTESTDIQATLDEVTFDLSTNLNVSGSASFTGNISAANATVDVLSADSGLFYSPSASVVATTVKGYSGQTANLTEWKNSAGTTLAHIDKDGKITSPVFVGTNVGNLSFYGINNTGSTISKGAPVVLTGLDSPSGNPTMTVANVADPTKMPSAGLAGADILPGATGEVVIIGQLHGVDTSSYSYNDILYVDGAGLLTNVKPTNPSHSVQPIGNIEKVATAINGGTILVNCTGTYAVSPNTIEIPGSVTASAGFYGSGANITSLNANNLSSGTVPSARLSLTTSDIPSITASKISDFATTAKGYTLDSFAVPVAAVAMNNQKITGMADPTSGSDAATKTYVDNLSSGLRIKEAVNRATNAILPNSPTYYDGAADSSQGLGDGAYLESATNTRLSVDGGNVTTGQRVLVKNQATASHNGIYYVTEQGAGGNKWKLTRADDSNNTPAGEVRKGDYVSVLIGSANAGTSWTIGNDGTATTPVNGIKIGTDAINWIQFNGAASYVAGGGMTLSGTTFDVATASSDRIVINDDSIDLATVSRSDTSGSPGGTRITSITTDSYGRVTGTVSSAQVDASTTVKGIASFDSGDFSVTSGAVTIKTGGVGNTQLENSTVLIGSSSVALGASVGSLAGLSSVSATTFTGNLTGNVSGNATSVTNGVYTTDTGTVTNTMLAGSIADSKLSTISTAGKVSNSATTATDANTANAIVARDASGNFTANIITAALSGNASTATTATTATNATNAAITDTTTTAGTYYPVFSSTSTGNSTLRTDSTGLTYDPSTNTITATNFAGNASTVTNGVYTTSKLSVLASTSSSELAGVISDETGTGGALVFASSPTITTPVIQSVTASAAGSTAALFNNVTTGTIGIGTGVTTGTINIGTSNAIDTGTINIGTGSTGANKTVAIGTAATGGITTINIGSTSGATSNISLNGTTTNTGTFTARQAATQDAVRLQGRAGGTGTFVATFTPATLSASRTLTIPDTAGTLVTTGDSGTVTSTMIANDTIVNADINTAAAIALSKLASGTSAQIIVANASGVPTYVAMSGDVTIDNTGATNIGAGVITNADINASAAIAYSKLSLTGSIVNADISTSASIAYSKLNLSGSIVNADISSSAAITHSKLANATSGQLLLGTTTTGVITATTVSGDVTIDGAGVTAIGSGVIVNADINASAAIAYSKLSLSGSIVNSDISSSAAIAHSKLANATDGQVLIGTTTTGVVTATTLTGDVTVTGAGVTSIGTGKVTSSMIVDGTIVDGDISSSASIALSKLATGALPTAITVASANIVDGTIVDGDINASAAIADTKLATISTANKVSNSATTATSANTASAIVARDSSGNFTAGTITATAIATASHYIGTTQVALNRSSANQGLTGITSIIMPGSTSGSVTFQPAAAAGTATITLPATTGTVITTGDTGTITSTMIADATIVNADISATAAIDLGKLADVSTNAQTASYGLVLADKNKVVEMNVATGNTLTVPLNSTQAFPIGSQINILQTGAGQTTITPTGGVTINATPGLKMRAQWSYATLIKRATDTWVLVGDISA